MKIRRYKTEKCRGKWAEHGELENYNFNTSTRFTIRQRCTRCNNNIALITFDTYKEFSTYLKEQIKIKG